MVFRLPSPDTPQHHSPLVDAMHTLRLSSAAARSLLGHCTHHTPFRTLRSAPVYASQGSTHLQYTAGGSSCPRPSRRPLLVRNISTNGTSPVLSPMPWPPLPKEKHNSAAFPPPPPQPSDGMKMWTDEVWASPLDVRRRIFCNRSLSLSSLSSIGFDMDYTIASYKPQTFETLAHVQTVDKLVKFFG